MATNAAAQGTLCALRREIARIEGRLAETLAAPDDGSVSSLARTVLRRAGRVEARRGLIETGAEDLDVALGGGLPAAGLIEVHGRETRDAGVVAGFTLALLSRAGAGRATAPVIWVGTSEIFREAGLPYAVGLRSAFGIEPAGLLMSEVPRLADALWIADAAASVRVLGAVVLEINSRHLDLSMTRRLHHRAAEAGRLVFLLRQSAEAEPTASPLRLVIAPSPAGTRRIFGRSLAGSIGPPAFAVTLDKNRLAPPRRFILEWNSNERTFGRRDADRHGEPQNPVALVPLSRHRADMAAAVGSRMAYGMLRFSAATGQPS